MIISTNVKDIYTNGFENAIKNSLDNNNELINKLGPMRFYQLKYFWFDKDDENIANHKLMFSPDDHDYLTPTTIVVNQDYKLTQEHITLYFDDPTLFIKLNKKTIELYNLFIKRYYEQKGVEILEKFLKINIIGLVHKYHTVFYNKLDNDTIEYYTNLLDNINNVLHHLKYIDKYIKLYKLDI